MSVFLTLTLLLASAHIPYGSEGTLDDLDPENICLSEDGCSNHQNLAFLDASGSMNFQDKQNMATLFEELHSIFEIQKKLKIYTFGTTLHPNIWDLQSWSNFKQFYLKNNLGSTKLWESVYDIAAKEIGRKEFDYLSIYVFTDGDDNQSSGKLHGPNGVKELYRLLKSDIKKLVINGIIYGENMSVAAKKAIYEIAKTSGGVVLEVGSSANKEKIEQIANNFKREIEKQQLMEKRIKLQNMLDAINIKLRNY
eukprot:538373_1